MAPRPATLVPAGVCSLVTEMSPSGINGGVTAPVDTAFAAPIDSNDHVHPAADERPGETWARLQDPAEFCADPECPYNAVPWEEWAN